MRGTTQSHGSKVTLLRRPLLRVYAAILGLGGCLCLAGAALAGQSDAAQSTQAATAAGGTAKPGEAQMTMEQFLDRLMRAESGGRLTARNPRSTALGPYQFIASTWLMMANKHFAKETKELRVDQILALRTDPDLARRAAELYTLENAAYLAAQGHKATFPHLRLAFLVGAGAASRVLSAPPEMPVSQLLSGNVILANPFMARMTASDLITRCARDLSATPDMTAGVVPDEAMVAAAKAAGAEAATSARARVAAPCNLTLPSCRRWLALAERRQAKATKSTSKTACSKPPCKRDRRASAGPR